jgi:Tfp pilus assembly protein PilO
VKRQVPATAIMAIALVLIAAVGYFLLVRPKQTEAGRLSSEAADLQAQVDAARTAASHQGSTPPAAESTIRFADLFRLTRAMPDKEDMAEIVLELNAAAKTTGIAFTSITPAAPQVLSTYSAVPINVTFEGSFFDITDFLFRVRNLVRVRDGRLEADGRLFSLDAIELAPDEANPKRVNASLTLTAYIYTTTPPPSATGTPAAPTQTTTPTTTAPTGEGSQALGGTG